MDGLVNCLRQPGRLHLDEKLLVRLLGLLQRPRHRDADGNLPNRRAVSNNLRFCFRA
jgi:hypothetical protein